MSCYHMAQTYMFYFSKLKTKIMFVTGTVALFIILKHIIVLIKVIKSCRYINNLFNHF